MVLKGQIKDFRGTWGSGIATLTVKMDTGETRNIPCDNAPTVRALESAFGNIISAGHKADIKNAKNKWIFFGLTDWGTLAGFVPVEQASPELLEDFARQKKTKSRKRLSKVV